MKRNIQQQRHIRILVQFNIYYSSYFQSYNYILITTWLDLYRSVRLEICIKCVTILTKLAHRLICIKLNYNFDWSKCFTEHPCYLLTGWMLLNVVKPWELRNYYSSIYTLIKHGDIKSKCTNTLMQTKHHPKSLMSTALTTPSNKCLVKHTDFRYILSLIFHPVNLLYCTMSAGICHVYLLLINWPAFWTSFYMQEINPNILNTYDDQIHLQIPIILLMSICN